VLDKIKKFFTQNIHLVDVLFGCLWLYSWFQNRELAMKYDLDKLNIFYATIRAYILADKIDNSVNNTPKGTFK
jgi:hypothetical protein